MSPRAIRRAAERQALKLAAKAIQPQVMTAAAAAGAAEQPLPFPVPSPAPSVDLSEARLAANRANAQLSTGPRTEAGKAISSLNAVKTGLTGRTVLLPSDDALAYQQHLARRFAKYAPIDDEERELVQSIADTDWRLLRIAPLEASIYANGRRALAHQVADESDPDQREALLLGQIFAAYRKDLSNLALQERRLRNQRKEDIAELEALRQRRLEKEQEIVKKRQDELARARMIAFSCQRLERAFDPAEHGFDFSIEEWDHYNAVNKEQIQLTQTSLDFDTVLRAYRAAQTMAKAA